MKPDYNREQDVLWNYYILRSYCMIAMNKWRDKNLDDMNSTNELAYL